ncbi:YjeF N-terminal domain-containing protein [Sphaerosporella brunnea]|uniref:Enhancer of mRNA-decapping protein 3 n=1 Tax=Sphaerosporella brunnea TaxID=1250544 RepID=A0A5J5F7X1_9PEZI|nr:YjeF N-terminal domain-containing protein [Sphaerosporella brunnea]
MAEQFIGVTVSLTLNDLERTQMRGLVANVVEQELSLTNVCFVKTGHVMPSYVVSGHRIHDIEIVEEGRGATPRQLPVQQLQTYPHVPQLQQNLQSFYGYVQQNGPPRFIPHQQPSPRVFSQPQQPPPPQAVPKPPVPLEDPAILSMSRKPSVTPVAAVKPPPPSAAITTPTRQPAQTVSSTNISRGDSLGTRQQQPSTSGAPPTMPAALRASNAGLENIRPSSHSSSLQQQFTEMSLRTDAAESSAFDETDDAASTFAPKFTGKRSRRGKATAQKQAGKFLEPIQQHQDESVVLQPGMFGGAVAAAAGAGYGLQSRRRGGKARHRRPRRSQRVGNADEEGWATEDVTDFKQTEFDFQGNLDRFDKKTVFSQIKAEDTTADEARLVSFNRLPRREKVPPKNYRNNENVLGNYANGTALADRDGWKTPEFGAGEQQSEDTDSEDDVIRGRNVAAADSGRSSRRAISRQSISNRLTRQLSTAGRVGSTDNLQALSSGGSGIMNKSGKPSFRLAPSNRPCPVVSPLQMLDVERIAEVELGLTDDMMTENAGRGIAQVAIQAFGKRINASNHNALPVVLVFAGNHKSGARAIAAGRHLKNHHVRVMACVIGLEREDELLENVRRQLNIFRNAGGRVATWPEMQSNLKSIDSPPELIIDGLLGMHLGFDDLRPDDQATAFELVHFANMGRASVLSVDIPTGVDGSSGKIPQSDDSDAVYMRARWVVCMGAPKTGLLNAVILGVGAGWDLFVADIGISNTAWRKYGTRRRHGVEFSSEWVTKISVAVEPSTGD